MKISIGFTPLLKVNLRLESQQQQVTLSKLVLRVLKMSLHFTQPS